MLIPLFSNLLKGLRVSYLNLKYITGLYYEFGIKDLGDIFWLDNVEILEWNFLKLSPELMIAARKVSIIPQVPSYLSNDFQNKVSSFQKKLMYQLTVPRNNLNLEQLGKYSKREISTTEQMIRNVFCTLGRQ